MKRTALLGAFFCILATPALSHPALPEGHIHGLEMPSLADGADYAAVLVAATLLSYVIRKVAKA
jgi:hypothetical protein